MVDVVSEDAADAWSSKRAKLETSSMESDVSKTVRAALRPCNSLPASSAQQTAVTSAAYSLANQNASPTLVSGYATSASAAASSQTYTCGQSSLFGELQSVVFHSLITSLES